MSSRSDIREHGGVVLVSVRGTIDESFAGKEFISRVEAVGSRAAPLVLDLDGAERITSFGVRQWLEAIRLLQSDSYYFIRCRPALVAQINSVGEFLGRGVVVSFYCPYVCTSCEEAFEKLVDLRHVNERLSDGAPPASCPHCGAAGEFDDLEEVYFGWLSKQPSLVLPAAVEAAIDGTRAPLRVTKALHGTVTVISFDGALRRSQRLKRYLDGIDGQAVIVLRGITEISEEGLQGLREQLEAVGKPLFLSHVPLSELSRVRAAFPAATFVSACVRTRCGECEAVSEQIVPAGAAATERHCSQCKKPLPPLAAELEALLSSPPAAGLPAEVSAALLSFEGKKPASPPLLTGALPLPERIGKYEIISRLGMGGMAEVLLGRHVGPEGFARKVVIKRILPHLAQREDFVRMFLNEGRVAARLSDSRVVQIYDLAKEGDSYVLVMEYVQGMDLQQLIRMSSELAENIPIELCARMGAEIAGGLMAAHEFIDDQGGRKPIFHRDVSPHNVLVGTDGCVKLADFGIAKTGDTEALTETGVIKGKLAYVAPEVVAGSEYSEQADLFAAGLVLYTMLTMHHPFRGMSEARTVDAILRSPIPDVGAARVDCPGALSRVVMKALEKDPAKRYQTARELLLALEEFLAAWGKPSSPTHLSTWIRSLTVSSIKAGLTAAESVGQDLLPTRSQAVVRKAEPEQD